MSPLDELTLASLRARARDLERSTDARSDLQIEWATSHRVHPPAVPAAVAAAEERLGFELPAILKQVYSGVANGGFGPGYGLIGIGEAGFRDDTGRDAVESYLAFREHDPSDPGYSWPERLLPVCHWGCAIYSCVDCREPNGEMVKFDPNPVDADWAIAFAPEGLTFASWLTAWLRGEKLFERGLLDAPGDPDGAGAS